MVLAPKDFTPYSTAKPLLGSAPLWLADPLEQQRVQAYSLYEQIYWNVPEAFKLQQRGTDDKPIYIPAGRQIVETLHRYLAAGLNVVADPRFGTTQEQELAQQVWDVVAKRERFYSGFTSAKRYGIIRGDWAFVITADDTRMPGTKVSIEQVDPGGLFPIWGGTDLNTIVGWHIVEQYTDRFGKERILRRTWRKTTGMGGPSPITYAVGVFEMDQWGGPGMSVDKEKPVTGEPVEVPETPLPPPIDDLPIYTIQNFQQPGFLWGSSEMRGVERLLSAINQSISDEELELVMNGLGTYATNAGAPIDEETGEELPWGLGPAKVVEVPGEAFFNRVSGVGTVMPYQDHLAYMHAQIDQTFGHSDVAKGKVDVTVAESGVALAIQMGPLMAVVSEKEQIITDVLTNFLFNFPKWMVAYEGAAFNSMVSVATAPGESTGTVLVPQYGPKMPENVDKRIDTLLNLLREKAIGLNFLWSELRRMGWNLPDDATMLAQVSETKDLLAPEDPFGAQMQDELASAGSNGDGA
jgi:hypothetical protein